MDANNWRPATQGEASGIDGNDWRNQLTADARKKIVNKIVETLKKHLPVSGPEGLGELQKIAVRFEEKIYTDATSQSDYLRKISMKMLIMENKSQPGSTNALPPNANPNPSDQGEPLLMPLANQSQSHQQLVPQNLADTAAQNSAGLPSALSSVSGLHQNAMSNVVSQGSNMMQAMPGMSQISLTGSVGQGVQSHMVTNSGRQMPGRLQQQSQNSPWLICQQPQPQHQLSKQKMRQGDIQLNLLLPHMQQQPLLQPNHMQSSQQSLIQMPSSNLSSSQSTQQTQLLMMQSSHSVIQRNQQSSVQQSASMDSTEQTGHIGIGDWQEEVYQKIKSMKELYLPELNEMYQKINLKFQYEGLVQHPKQPEQLEKLRFFRSLLERMIAFLQMTKNNITIALRDKLPTYEKQIQDVLSSNRTKKPKRTKKPGMLPQQQQVQQPPPGGPSHPMMQQSQSQMTQIQQHDNHLNQMQSTSIQPPAATGMLHASVPLSAHLGVPPMQQNVMNEPSSNLESTTGNTMSSMIGSLQHNTMGLQQNTINASQQTSINTLSQFIQQQQQKQQQKPPQSVQLQQHQMPRLHQMNETNELKVRSITDTKNIIFLQHHPSGQCPTYQQQQQQQLKMNSKNSMPMPSPQFFQAQSPQIYQYSSPQIDQQILFNSAPKSGTPLQSASSPFVVPPFPSTPLAPSPLPGDTEKQRASGISSISGAGNVGHQQVTAGLTQSQSLAIGMPGISVSPLLADFSTQDGNQVGASAKSIVTERPLECWIKVVVYLLYLAFNLFIVWQLWSEIIILL